MFRRLHFFMVEINLSMTTTQRMIPVHSYAKMFTEEDRRRRVYLKSRCSMDWTVLFLAFVISLSQGPPSPFTSVVAQNANANDGPGYFLWVYVYRCQFNDKRQTFTPYLLDSCRTYYRYKAANNNGKDYNPGRIHLLPSFNVRVKDKDKRYLLSEGEAIYEFKPYEYFFEPRHLNDIIGPNYITIKDYIAKEAQPSSLEKGSPTVAVDLLVTHSRRRGDIFWADEEDDLFQKCSVHNTIITLPDSAPAKEFEVYGAFNATARTFLCWNTANGTELMEAVRPYRNVLALGLDNHEGGNRLYYTPSDETTPATKAPLTPEDQQMFKFMGPVRLRAVHAIVFASYIEGEANRFIREELHDEPFLSVHWRFAGGVSHSFDEVTFADRLREWLLNLAKEATETKQRGGNFVMPTCLVLASDNFDEESQAFTYSLIHKEGDETKLDDMSKAFLSLPRKRYFPKVDSMFDKEPGLLAVVEQAIVSKATFFLASYASTYSEAIRDVRIQKGLIPLWHKLEDLGTKGWVPRFRNNEPIRNQKDLDSYLHPDDEFHANPLRYYRGHAEDQSSWTHNRILVGACIVILMSVSYIAWTGKLHLILKRKVESKKN